MNEEKFINMLIIFLDDESMGNFKSLLFSFPQNSFICTCYFILRRENIFIEFNSLYSLDIYFIVYLEWKVGNRYSDA